MPRGADSHRDRSRKTDDDAADTTRRSIGTKHMGPTTECRTEGGTIPDAVAGSDRATATVGHNHRHLDSTSRAYKTIVTAAILKHMPRLGATKRVAGGILGGAKGPAAKSQAGGRSSTTQTGPSCYKRGDAEHSGDLHKPTYTTSVTNHVDCSGQARRYSASDSREPHLSRGGGVRVHRLERKQERPLPRGDDDGGTPGRASPVTACSVVRGDNAALASFSGPEGTPDTTHEKNKCQSAGTLAAKRSSSLPDPGRSQLGGDNVVDETQNIEELAPLRAFRAFGDQHRDSQTFEGPVPVSLSLTPHFAHATGRKIGTDVVDALRQVRYAVPADEDDDKYTFGPFVEPGYDGCIRDVQAPHLPSDLALAPISMNRIDLDALKALDTDNALEGTLDVLRDKDKFLSLFLPDEDAPTVNVVSKHMRQHVNDLRKYDVAEFSEKPVLAMPAFVVEKSSGGGAFHLELHSSKRQNGPPASLQLTNYAGGHQTYAGCKVGGYDGRQKRFLPV